MPLYQAIVLAVIQALTEFLPISSTAHLALAPWLFGWTDPGLTFDVALHAGTLLAIVIYFFRDWLQIIAQGLGLAGGPDAELRQNRKLLWLLVIGTIPIGVAGLLFDKQAEGAWRTPYVIGAMLIGVGIVMWMAERWAGPVMEPAPGDLAYAPVGGGAAAVMAPEKARTIAETNGVDAVVIGLAQALAVVPGTSRSGATITAGLFRGMTREAAARFSFLLSTPAIAAAVAKKGWDIHKHGGLPADMRLPFAAGVLASGVLGAVVIAFFLKYLRRHSLMPFVYYRIVFGIIVIALAVLFRFHAG